MSLQKEEEKSIHHENSLLISLLTADLCAAVTMDVWSLFADQGLKLSVLGSDTLSSHSLSINHQLTGRKTPSYLPTLTV